MAFNVQDYTAETVAKMQAAAQAFGDAGENLQKAIERAFAAQMVADPIVSGDTVSVLLAEKLKGYPSVGPRRTWAASFFNDVNNAKALRVAIGDPSALSIADFNARIEAYCEGINSRKAYEAAKKLEAQTKKAAAAEALARQQAQAAEAAQNLDDVVREEMTVEDAYAKACAIIDALAKAGETQMLEDLRDVIEAALASEEAERLAA